MRVLFFLFLIISGINANGQIITGHLTEEVGRSINLVGFHYDTIIEIAVDTIDNKGNFVLKYDKNYKGMGILKTSSASIIVLLDNEDIEINGTFLGYNEKLDFVKGSQNKKFLKFIKNQSIRDNIKPAWNYLKPLYEKEKVLNSQLKIQETITKELKRLKEESVKELNTFSKNSYLYWFIPMRQFVNDMTNKTHKKTELIYKYIEKFRNINFSASQFKTSGLFKELIEGHYFMLENMGKSLDNVYAEMNKSTNYIIQNLQSKPEVLNMVGEKLLAYFEKRSLFPAAAYLSEQLISNNTCLLEKKLTNRIQKYYALKKGNIAPDIQLLGKKLSDYKKPLVLVFGASWCTHCQKDIEKLEKYYKKWKNDKGVEVVYISIDTDTESYKAKYKNKEWLTYCDYKGWETQAAIDYYINATPTYIILDEDLTILEHPVSIEQIDTWINYKF